MQHENATLVETEQRMEAEPQASTGQQDSMPCLEPAIFRIDGHDVHGARKDPVGLVGRTVMLTFQECSGSHRCVVEAFAPDAAGGAAYIVSWKAQGRPGELEDKGRPRELGSGKVGYGWGGHQRAHRAVVSVLARSGGAVRERNMSRETRSHASHARSEQCQ